jgi:AraC-like DNA-binding protein
MKVIKERIYHFEQSLRCMRFTLQAFAMERHRHPQFELTWIERGAGVRFVGDSAAPFSAGDLVLVGSEVPHTWVSSTAPGEKRKAPSDACIANVVQFSAELFTQAALPELRSLGPLLGLAARGLSVTGKTHTVIMQRMVAMQALDALGQLEQLLGIIGALHRAGADLRPIATAATEPARASGPARRIDRVIQWMHHHMGQPMDLQAAAEAAHVSPAAFSRFFKRETGKTFTDYVNDLRCARACVLLRESKAPIAVVAADCGFLTSSHFNRQFLARIGKTPRDYRG